MASLNLKKYNKGMLNELKNENPNKEVKKFQIELIRTKIKNYNKITGNKMSRKEIDEIIKENMPTIVKEIKESVEGKNLENDIFLNIMRKRMKK